MYTWKINKWTSDLIISTSVDINDSIKSEIIDILAYIESRYSNFIEVREVDNLGYLSNLLKYGINGDYTCMLKGLAIDKIHNLLCNYQSTSHVISFGGDIFGYNTSAKVDIDNTKFSIDLEGTFSVFTSGNTKKRGNHIIGCREGIQLTTVTYWEESEVISNTLIDIITTKYVAGEANAISELNALLHNKSIAKFAFTELGYLINDTYIASPFFNEDQITIRDEMIKPILNGFRPDLTESSKLYDADHSGDLASVVVQDNLDGIATRDMLVYPKDTTDLGTLYEVGRAISLGKPVIMYDHNNSSYSIICNNIFKDLDIVDEPTLFNCSKKSQVILFGYFSHFISPKNLFYELRGEKDNIMLSVNYTHVEFDKDNNKFIKIIRDKNERDS